MKLRFGDVRRRRGSKGRQSSLTSSGGRRFGVAFPRASPADVHPATVMLQAVQDARPHRQSVLQEALAGESLTFHSFGPVPDEP